MPEQGSEPNDADPNADRHDAKGGHDAAESAAAMTSWGIGIGLALGAGLGVVLDNLALGIGIGIAIGAGIGAALSARAARKQK